MPPQSVLGNFLGPLRPTVLRGCGLPVIGAGRKATGRAAPFRLDFKPKAAEALIRTVPTIPSPTKCASVVAGTGITNSSNPPTVRLSTYHDSSPAMIS